MEMTMIDQSIIDRRIERTRELKERANGLKDRFAQFASRINPVQETGAVEAVETVVEAAPIQEVVRPVQESVASVNVTAAPIQESTVQSVADVAFSDADLDSMISGIFESEEMSL